MKTNAIFTDLITLEELLKNRKFIVPDYQRGYSWDKPQLEDLKNDIINMFESDLKHYTGTIVATPNEQDENLLEIVDGQQRLTTLLILIKVILDTYPDKYSDFKSHYILEGNIGNEKLKLQLNKETAQFFYDYVIYNRSVSPEIKSQRMIKIAVEFFKPWVIESEDIVDKIVEVITNKLGFLLFIPGNNKEIGIMFEVINNRGKALSELEKIKNYFIYFSTIHSRGTLREHINNKWGIIQKNLSHAEINDNDDENSFLRNCYLVFFYASKTKSWYVYNELKEKFPPRQTDELKLDDSIIELQDFINFLENCSLYIAYLENGKYFESHYKGLNIKEIGNNLKLLRCQHVKASIMPLYLAIMDKYINEPEKLIELLNILEILNFRVYILPKVTSRADTMQGELFWLAYKFYTNDLQKFVEDYNSYYKLKSDNFETLKESLIRFTKRNCNELKFIQHLTIDKDEVDEDYYKWNGIRYFLARYEHYLQLSNKHYWDIEKILLTRKETCKNTNDYLSIEHIWAKANLSDELKVGENHIEKRRLGNFVLMGLAENITNRDKDIPIKIKEMFEINNDKNVGGFMLKQIFDLQHDIKNASEFIDKIRTNHNWAYFAELSKKLNDIRETTMINFALDTWKQPEETFSNFKGVDSFANKDHNFTYVINKEQETNNE
jgi:hypothetical protein